MGSKKPLGCGYAANGTVWICLDQRGPFEGTAREKRRWRELLDEAEDHELMADNDDEDSTTLLVPPAAKEALALVPSALMVSVTCTSHASTHFDQRLMASGQACS